MLSTGRCAPNFEAIKASALSKLFKATNAGIFFKSSASFASNDLKVTDSSPLDFGFSVASVVSIVILIGIGDSFGTTELNWPEHSRLLRNKLRMTKDFDHDFNILIDPLEVLP